MQGPKKVDAELFVLYEVELGGVRRDRLHDGGPQEGVHQHTMEPAIEPSLEVPVFQMVRQLVDVRGT